MKIVSFLLNYPLLKKLDKLVEASYYASRSEAVRLAVKDLLEEHEKESLFVDAP